MYIEVKNDDLGAALRKLKKKVFNEQILVDFVKKSRYEKPSDKRRRKRQEAIRRQRRDREKQLKERGY